MKFSDMAIMWLLLGVGIAFIRTKDWSIYMTPYVLIVIGIFFLIAIQAALASINYQQPLIDGLIITRTYWCYIAFLVILYLLDDSRKLHQFLDLLTWVAFILIGLSVINYINPVVFHHDWAEGQGIRSGIVRAYIPGMDLLTLSTLWQFSKWSEEPREKGISSLKTVVLYAAHIFRQSRGRLLSLTIVIMGLLLFRRQYKILFITGFFSIAGYLLVENAMEENLLESVFVSSVESISESSGTWGSRLDFMSTDIEHFKKNVWFGDGVGALRLDEEAKYKTLQEIELQDVAAKADLGYTRWLKSFGILGALWLVALYYFFINGIMRTSRSANPRHRVLVLFVLGYFSFIVISAITLNQFMLQPRIFLISLCAAILIRVAYEQRREKSGLPDIPGG
ncbi:hypothetical protein F0M18_12830 [Pseudohalioglobus sediminis]|uniref:Uncharacterized protein n=1 Tax=Pseudohalioglobus sediminis TaxID=2606449 RepID=A0A5B0WSQ1_9GAMM|nr:O-antigen ligase family protein [Pseudohalioglobus sediminis]KAA1189953.1 hypothetical protein F0M18_12830 [Pseudohalioglobus sediminis]